MLSAVLNLSRTIATRVWLFVLFTAWTPVVHGQPSIVAVGNSISLHGPKPAWGWNGRWGMNASSAELDYLHILQRRLADSEGHSAGVRVISGSEIERGIGVPDSLFAEVSSDNPELIIIQLGDNVDPEIESRFQKLYIQLVSAAVSEFPSTSVVCVGRWFRDAGADERYRPICESGGARFASLVGIREAQAIRRAKNPPATARVSSGVLAHPDDTSMRLIAERILYVLGRRN